MSDPKGTQLLDLIAYPHRGQVQPWRVLALFSASIALANERTIEQFIIFARQSNLERVHFYEVILQSYLFLGFPRMLGAGEMLGLIWPAEATGNDYVPDLDAQFWRDRGEILYSQVYGDNAERLKDRVTAFAPEIFDWMIVEGYGKVLSRPGLDIVARELSIVAFLMIDDRPKQLMSHLRGAHRVGATLSQINQVIDDLRGVAGPNCLNAREMVIRLGIG